MRKKPLTAKQKKLDKNKNNKLDKEDFALLRKGKAKKKLKLPKAKKKPNLPKRGNRTRNAMKRKK